MEQNQCNNLGNNCEEQINNCPNCEANETASKSIVCTECGTAYDENLSECPNCGCPKELNEVSPAEDAPVAAEEEAECPVGGAFNEFFCRLFYVVFVLPYKTWKAAASRLAVQGKKNHCYEGEKTEWPLISYCRKFLLDYLFDALILISWLSLAACVWDLLHYGNATVCTWIAGVYVCYLMPAIITVAKDLVIMVICYPVRRLINIHKMHAKCIDRKLEERSK